MAQDRYIVPDGPDIGREFRILENDLSETFCQWIDNGEPFDYVESFVRRCRVPWEAKASEYDEGGLERHLEAEEQTRAPAGRKDDKGKPTWRLLYTFLPEIEGMVRVLEFGAKKYAPENWKLVPDAFNRYGEAGRRHLMASLAGEEKDVSKGGSGEYHELSVIVCMLFRLAARRMGLK